MRLNRGKKISGSTRPGFTLIELLVVVAVITLLVAILLPSLGKAREQARAVACGANLRSISQAFQVYASEYDGWLPTIDYYISGTPQDYYFWATEIRAVLNLKNQNTKLFMCPSIPIRSGAAQLFYTMNQDIGAKQLTTGYFYATKLTDYAAPGSTVLLWDCSVGWTSVSKSLGWVDTNPAWIGPYLYTTRFTEIHNGKAGVSFVDGHVEQFPWLRLKAEAKFTRQ